MKKARTFGLLLVFLALAIAFPLLFSDPTVTTIAVFTLIFAGAAAAWNIFSGYTGYISLGHTTFYGLGAYALALTCQHWSIQDAITPFLLLPLAGLVAAAFAIPLGWIALRTKRQTFMVITIAIFFIFQLLAYNLHAITNGSAGVYLPNPPWSEDIFNLPFYYVSLFLLLLAAVVSWWVRHSKYGLGLLAIRDDEDRALGLGVKTGTYKLGAYVISAFFVGMAGALTAYFIGSVFPNFAFDPTFDPIIVVMVLLGGIGTLVGPILGALLLEPLQQYLTLQFGSIAEGLDLLLFGILFLAIILLLPGGIVPTLSRRWAEWIASRENARVVSHTTSATGHEKSMFTEGSKGKG